MGLQNEHISSVVDAENWNLEFLNILFERSRFEFDVAHFKLVFILKAPARLEEAAKKSKRAAQEKCRGNCRKGAAANERTVPIS